MYSGMYSTIQSPVVRTEDPSHKDPREGVCVRANNTFLSTFHGVSMASPWRPEKKSYPVHATQRISRAECVVSSLDGAGKDSSGEEDTTGD